MRYADTLLANGEIIVLRSRQHWLALIAKARWALLAWLVTIAALIVIAVLDLESPARDVVGWIALAALVVGIVLFFLHAWRWWAQDYIVTNRRIMKVEGVFNKHAADSSLEKINDAVLRQGVIARMLGYGDLDILTAADSAIDRYRMLAHAAHFKVEMLNRKHALDLELGGAPPAPPVRVDRPAQATTSGPTPAPTTVAGSPAAIDEADDPETITRTLAQLSDLRDRGAITADEYEAKKRDLLERL
jgi:membrane protein YdbS with pleckstrin-like domain